MNFLIVDDEPLIRLGVRKTLEKIYNDNCTVFEANNGRKAVEIILKNKINVVFTDIRMPEMDGVELAKWINNSKLPINIIIMSSYKDFDSIKRCYEYGAKEYMFKYDTDPVKLSNIISKVTSDKQFNDAKTIYDETESEPYYVVALQVDSKNSKIINTIKDIINDIEHALIDNPEKKENTGENILIILIKSFYKKEKIKINKVLDKIISTIKEETDITISLGISNEIKGLRNIKTGKKQALNALEFKFINGTFSINTYKKQEKKLYSINEEIAVKNNLIKSIYYKDFRSIINYLSELKVKYNDINTEKIVHIKNIYLWLREIMELHFYNYKEKMLELNKINIQKAEYLQDIQHEFIKVLESIAEKEFNIKKFNNCSEGIKKVISYIHNNYSDEGLTLQQLAKFSGYSSSYLCRLFKKEIGLNIVEYINEIRIEKSKELLEKEIKISEVAGLVGFNNYAYFGKVFKKTTGITPKEYTNKTTY